LGGSGLIKSGNYKILGAGLGDPLGRPYVIPLNPLPEQVRDKFRKGGIIPANWKGEHMGSPLRVGKPSPLSLRLM